ncbi:MAG: flippase-like domain-containing protein [Acidobacteriia bacterium]|nr:flippase-like domain-containing protein [Terriglobia bacterium]
MRRLAQIIISIGLTFLIGYLIYRSVPDWGNALHVMIQGSPLLLLAGLCFVTLHMLLRAARWGVLLTPSKANISYQNLLALTLVKYAVNVIPPRTGEVAASVILARKEKLSVATVIAASVFERILDTVTVLIFFVGYLIFFSQRYSPNAERGKEIIISVRSYSIKGLIALGIGFAIAALLMRSTHWADRIPLRIRGLVLHFLDGFRALQSRGAMPRVVLLSFAIWLAITMQLWCLVRAYLSGFPLAGTVLLVVLTVVGVSIPTPAGVGGFQFFMSLGLVNFFSRYLSLQDLHSQAAGIGNGCYVLSMAPMIIAGLVFLNREGLSIGRMARLGERTQEELRLAGLQEVKGDRGTKSERASSPPCRS